MFNSWILYEKYAIKWLFFCTNCRRHSILFVIMATQKPVQFRLEPYCPVTFYGNKDISINIFVPFSKIKLLNKNQNVSLGTYKRLNWKIKMQFFFGFYLILFLQFGTIFILHKEIWVPKNGNFPSLYVMKMYEYTSQTHVRTILFFVNFHPKNNVCTWCT